MAKQINEALESLQESISNTPQSTAVDRAASVDPQINMAMETLWLRLSEMHPLTWTKNYGLAGGEVFQTWCLAMRDRTPADIKRAFTKLLQRNEPYPPNLNDLRSLSDPTGNAVDVGLLSEDDAFWLAVNWKNTDAERRKPEVLAALRQMDLLKFRTEPEENARKRFNRAYAAVVAGVAAGEELPVVPVEIEHEVPKSAPEVGAAAMDKIKEILNG